MLLRGVLVGSLFALTATAHAVAPTRARLVGDTLTALPAAGVARPLRAQADVRWSGPASPAWQKLAATGAWRAAWDRATGVPSRLWGGSLPAPGAIADADAAARFARAALADHLALLAPGATPADFALVANVRDGDLRVVGFVQRHAGRVVVGGQISFRFKRDRLFVIASEALPNIALPAAPRARLAPAALRDRAAATARAAIGLPAASAAPPGAEVILPLVGDDAVLGYRLAVPVTLDGGADGRYLAYADAATGETLAARPLTASATGTVLYRAVDRYPGRPRVDRPAPRAHVTVGGAPTTTTTGGQVTWTGGASQQVATSVIGDLVAVSNRANAGMGALASAELSLAASGAAVWDASAAVEDDAQVQTYLNVNTAKDFARVLDPAMRTLDDAITANVNIARDCNAFFDGTSLNFFHASDECQNTGLIQDVVYHEYGHAVHAAEVIDGVGAVDGAMGEGAADFFAAQITEDPKMGRGFFYDDRPLRDLDPDGKEQRWPDDIAEIHYTGMIFGGTFWDLRKALIAQLGAPAGVALTQRLFIGALRRSVGIPSSLIEVLATDDDDGDLGNGTPHECAIRDAYARHGLRSATGVIDAPAMLAQAASAVAVRVELSGLAERCGGDEIAKVELSWQPGGRGGPRGGSAMAVKSGPDTFTAQLPLATDGTVLYQARVAFTDGTVLTLPDNLADPYYQLYQGKTVPLYCTDFEARDPLADGWTTGAGADQTSPWAWVVPHSGATDPPHAFSGLRALVQAPDGDYAPMTTSFVTMPVIDVGHWSDVHLQYRRWLAVEDSHFDQARITVNGQPAWINATQDRGDTSSLAHVDREWRFQDVVVSGYAQGHTIEIGWDLTTDPGLEFGGWALDDVCVVANVNGVCGDGRVTIHETCDDGAANADVPDACRTWCQVPTCGDHIVDRGEQCDDGPTGGIGCSAKCELLDGAELGGCCSAERGLGGSGVLALLVGLVVRRRRRG
jgi:cysteine-rich repeat protein